MYDDDDLMAAYDRWCENEYDTEGDGDYADDYAYEYDDYADYDGGDDW